MYGWFVGQSVYFPKNACKFTLTKFLTELVYSTTIHILRIICSHSNILLVFTPSSTNLPLPQLQELPVKQLVVLAQGRVGGGRLQGLRADRVDPDLRDTLRRLPGPS